MLFTNNIVSIVCLIYISELSLDAFEPKQKFYQLESKLIRGKRIVAIDFLIEMLFEKSKLDSIHRGEHYVKIHLDESLQINNSSNPLAGNQLQSNDCFLIDDWSEVFRCMVIVEGDKLIDWLSESSKSNYLHKIPYLIVALSVTNSTDHEELLLSMDISTLTLIIYTKTERRARRFTRTPINVLAEKIKQGKLPDLMSFLQKAGTPKRNENQSNKQRKRSPRRSGKSRKRSDLCRRRSLFVDFSDFGWDEWIVAPLGYQAYYCEGECPYTMSQEMNATNHAIIQMNAHLFASSDTRIPRPCCVPISLSPLTILYQLRGQVAIQNYKDMIVNACGCG